MSVEFALRDNRLDQAGWAGLCTTWLEGRTERIYDPAGFNADQPESCYIAGEGSIRGFSIVLREDAAQIRLGALASISDWQRCFSLCRLAVEQGGGTLEREDGQTYPPEQLTDHRAATEGHADFVATLPSITGMMAQQQTDSMVMPTPLCKITISRDALTGDPTAVMERLAARFQAYAEAHRPSFGLQHPELGQGCIVSAWGCLFPKLGFVAMPTEADMDSKPVALPWDRFEALFGPHLQDTGDDTVYLPPYAELPPEVLAGIPAAAVSDVAAGPTGASSDATTRDADRDTAILVMAPLLVVLLVAGSDGSIDRKEMKAAVDWMQYYLQNGSSARVQSLFGACLDNADAVLAKLRSGSAPLTVLTEVGAAIRHALDPQDAADYRDALIELATAVAGASGGILGLFGSKISAEERSTIALIEKMLSGGELQK